MIGRLTSIVHRKDCFCFFTMMYWHPSACARLLNWYNLHCTIPETVHGVVKDQHMGYNQCLLGKLCRVNSHMCCCDRQSMCTSQFARYTQMSYPWNAADSIHVTAQRTCSRAEVRGARLSSYVPAECQCHDMHAVQTPSCKQHLEHY